MLTRTSSKLPDSVERLVYRIIGCALEVHRRLGCGFLEAVYHKALRVELKHAGLAFKSEHCITIKYRDEPIHGHQVDLIVENAVIVEVKAVADLHPIHESQVVSYLRATGLQVGLLINFNSIVLKDGIQRIVR